MVLFIFGGFGNGFLYAEVTWHASKNSQKCVGVQYFLGDGVFKSLFFHNISILYFFQSPYYTNSKRNNLHFLDLVLEAHQGSLGYNPIFVQSVVPCFGQKIFEHQS